MKEPTASFTSAVDRTALAKAASPAFRKAIRPFSSSTVDGRVAQTRPRSHAHSSCAGKNAKRSDWARQHSQSA